MSTSLLLEGPDIETVLTRVREEHGAGARIVSAEKVRRGGFAGFFARERIEVAVELPESSLPDVAATGPTSLLELTEEVSAQERAAAIGSTGSTVSTRPAGAAVSAASTISTSGSTFADVLASLRTAHEASSPTAIPAPTGLPIPLPAGRRIIPAALVASAFPTQSAPVDSRSEMVLVVKEPVAVPVRTAIAAAPPPRPVVDPQLDPATPPVQDAAGPRSALRALGLPEQLIPPAAADTYPALLTALRAGLPGAPPISEAPGEIHVIVGEGRAALEVAHAQASALGLDERSVLVVTATAGLVPASRRLSTAEEVARKAERLAVLRRPSVVVVDTAFSRAGADRSRALLAALGASACWALVDATRKTADAAAWLGRLGRVDALVVEGSASTQDPAALLALGRPVALVDRRPATPALWAGLVCARLAGEVEQS